MKVPLVQDSNENILWEYLERRQDLYLVKFQKEQQKNTIYNKHNRHKATIDTN